jgi:hypothetical protein
MKKLEKNRHVHDWLHLLAAIVTRWQRPVASNEALDLLYWAMQVVSYRRTATAIKMASKVGLFLSSFRFLSPWRLPGQYGASSCPMAASSGFLGSPGHAALGDTSSIASTHPHGHQNGTRRRCICLFCQICHQP